MTWTRITERIVDDIVVLDVNGGWSSSAGPTSLLNVVQDLIEQGRVNILVNLTDVRSVDSDGLGEIVRGFNDARQARGQLALYGVSPHLRELLVTMKLHEYIPLYDSEQQGIRSLQGRALGRSASGTS